MNKKEFVKNVCNVLRQSDIKKPISIPKQVFHISDDEGNSKDFTVKKSGKSVIYTIDDVDAIVEACLCVIEDSLKRGEPVTFSGFGSIGLKYRKPRMTKQLWSKENIVIDGRYVPKFTFGNNLRMCAKLYELSLGDRLADEQPIDDSDYDDLDDDEDGDS